jgi:hypothetical protein
MIIECGVPIRVMGHVRTSSAAASKSKSVSSQLEAQHTCVSCRSSLSDLTSKISLVRYREHCSSDHKKGSLSIANWLRVD